MNKSKESTLADIIYTILDRQNQNGQQNHSSRIYKLKAAADMLNFLTDNKIMDMMGLDGIRRKIKVHDRAAVKNQ